MRTAMLVAAALLTGACVHRARPNADAGASRAFETRASAAGTFGDTSAVRRLCVVSDSVIAGRRSCELRNQAPFRTF